MPRPRTGRESGVAGRPHPRLPMPAEVRLEQHRIRQQPRHRPGVRERIKPVWRAPPVRRRRPRLQQRAGGRQHQERQPHGCRQQRQNPPPADRRRPAAATPPPAQSAAPAGSAPAAPNAPATAPTARRPLSQCAYPYPASSITWKNSMHAVHTAADPPNHGRISLAMSGCTWNSRNALSRMQAAKAPRATRASFPMRGDVDVPAAFKRTVYNPQR